jgi:hypothetical protein
MYFVNKEKKEKKRKNKMSASTPVFRAAFISRFVVVGANRPGANAWVSAPVMMHGAKTMIRNAYATGLKGRAQNDTFTGGAWHSTKTGVSYWSTTRV